MLRVLLLIVLSPFWLPIRGFRYLTSGRRRADVLVLDVRGNLPDLPRSSSMIARLFGRSGGGLDLVSLIQALDVATRDGQLKQVVVQIEELHCGLVRAEEVRAAFVRLRQAGKQVLVFAESLSMDSYWLALGASEVCLTPTGTLSVTGIALEFTLLKGFLDKVGLRAQLDARGKYKSMKEMFTHNDVSDANREMLEAITSNLLQQFKREVGNARKLSAEQVDTALASGPLRAQQALEFGLVDRLVYADELRLEREKLRHVTLTQYQRRLRARRLLPKRRNQVALLQVTNTIKSGRHNFGPNGARRATGSAAFIQTLRRVTKAPHVKAVILRVDSPGGSALASDVMWRELNVAVKALETKRIPFVVSMANTAASGGYYVSGVRGVEVWASPLTLTGSIGVVAGKYEASGLLAKLGIKRVAVTSGPRANYNSWSTPWSDVELAKLAEDLDAAYHDFVSKMADARQMSHESLHAVAQGRVWTGEQARQHRLVDRLGTLYDVCQALSPALGAPLGELNFWDPDAKAGLGRRKPSEHDSPLLEAVSGAQSSADTIGTSVLGISAFEAALSNSQLEPLLYAMQLASFLGRERTLALSPVQLGDP